MDEIKLVCFDLDQTLITQNSWLELGKGLGISEEEDARIEAIYRSGQITYDEWNDMVLERYLEHTDATRAGITNILSKYKFNDGAREAVQHVQSRGYKTVLVSGSIDIIVSLAAKDLNIQLAKANNSFVFDDNDRLVSIHSGGSDTHAKLRYLESFCELEGVSIEQSACIGDGSNDVEMFRKTKHGVTFRGSKIESEAWKVIDTLHDIQNIF